MRAIANFRSSGISTLFPDVHFLSRFALIKGMQIPLFLIHLTFNMSDPRQFK